MSDTWFGLTVRAEPEFQEFRRAGDYHVGRVLGGIDCKGEICATEETLRGTIGREIDLSVITAGKLRGKALTSGMRPYENSSVAWVSGLFINGPLVRSSDGRKLLQGSVSWDAARGSIEERRAIWASEEESREKVREIEARVNA